MLIQVQVWFIYWFGRIVLGVPRPQSSQLIDLTQINRVLVIRSDEIGDLVLTTPLLRELRRLLPAAWITLVVNPVTYNLVEHCPYVNQVLVYDQRVSRRWRPLILPWRALQMARRCLRSQRFDLALCPRRDTDGYYSIFLAYLSCAAWRVGYSEAVSERKRRLNRGFDRLLTHQLGDSNPKHEVKSNLDLIRYFGKSEQDTNLELWLTGEDNAFARQTLGLGSLPTKPLVAFGVGAGAARRRWPIEGYVALGAWLKQCWEASILVVGGPAERALGYQLMHALGDGVMDLTGRATLRETAALFKQCHVYVGNDAGPKHLAAAAGIPIVEILSFPLGGPNCHWNSPWRFGSWGVPHRILQPEKACPPCQDACTATEPHCIRSVTVEQVQRAVAGVLACHVKKIETAKNMS